MEGLTVDSTAIMVERLSGLLDTGDLTIREHDFVEKLVKMKNANILPRLSEKQLDWLVDLHKKHFA